MKGVGWQPPWPRPLRQQPHPQPPQAHRVLPVDVYVDERECLVSEICRSMGLDVESRPAFCC